MSKKISDLLPQTEILAQLAEEASELAQAALKLRRALDGTNPTPKSIEECEENLAEEVGDVMVCLYAIDMDDTDEMFDSLSACWYCVNEKPSRWLRRLEERERKKDE